MSEDLRAKVAEAIMGRTAPRAADAALAVLGYGTHRCPRCGLNQAPSRDDTCPACDLGNAREVIRELEERLDAQTAENERLLGQLDDTQCELADARLELEAAETLTAQTEAERDRLREANEQLGELNRAMTVKLEMVRELVTMPHNAKVRLSSRVLSVLDMPDQPPAALGQGEQEET